MNCSLELKKRYQDGRVIPFVGAGASMSVTWERGGKQTRGPSWSELVDRATKILGFENPDLARVRGSDFQILEYFKLRHSKQTAKLTNWLFQEMNPQDDDLLKSPIHRELVGLSQCRLIYTTNYDNFIERTFALRKRKCNVVAVEAQMGTGNSECEIIKFHGDLDHPDQIVLTESDYEKRLSLSTAMDHRLRADLLGRVILFIGYSFRDPNVSYLFRLFIDHFFDKPGALPGDRGYILLPDPSEFEVELFEARRIRVVAVRRLSIAEDIANFLTDMRS